MLLDYKKLCGDCTFLLRVDQKKYDDKEIENYEREYFVSLVLWEMTWFGYDEETIQNRWKELSYYIDEHEFMEKFMKIAQCNLGDKKEGYLEK